MGKSPGAAKPKLGGAPEEDSQRGYDTMENMADAGSWGYQATENMHPPAEHPV